MGIHGAHNPHKQVANCEGGNMLSHILNSLLRPHKEEQSLFCLKPLFLNFLHNLDSLCLALLDIVIHVKEAPPVGKRAKVSVGPVLQKRDDL